MLSDMKLFILAVLVCVINQSYGASFNLNKVVDDYIQRLNEKTRADGRDQVELPEVDREWTQKVARLISVKCTFHCEGGWMKNTSTLRRTGDVSLTTSGEKLILNFHMGLDEVFVHYDSCRFHARRIGSSTNKVDISVSGLSINGQVTLLQDENHCNLTLDHINVENMGKIDISFGNSVFQKVQSKLLEIFSDLFENKIKNALNKNLDRQIKKTIDEKDLCSKIEL